MVKASGICRPLTCIFCGIVARSIQAYIIFEDGEHVAFLDKYPTSIGHTLVLPKPHFERVKDMSEEAFSNLYSRVYVLNRIITSRLSATASHISINDGAAANQLIPHLHVHIIPRSYEDSAGFNARKLLRPDQMEEVRKKLEIDDLRHAV